ncbi:putative ADP-ribose pyrophosphatase protein [unidentified eubacterium SCB49]|nr:putative ADP-ribose pyrophosphatase protein [unidentified eubacterium SCB49]
MKYKIIKEEIVFEDVYQVLKAEVSYNRFKGANINTKRIAFHRGDGVTILLYEKDTDCILLANQFRYPTTKHHSGWLTEVPAGSLEENENPVSCIKREVLEEVGYKVNDLIQVFDCYPSPGACTEKTYLFFAEVKSSDKIENGGGLMSENEDIKLIKLPVSEIKNFLNTEAKDAKTIILLQWFLLRE